MVAYKKEKIINFMLIIADIKGEFPSILEANRHMITIDNKSIGETGFSIFDVVADNYAIDINDLIIKKPNLDYFSFYEINIIREVLLDEKEIRLNDEKYKGLEFPLYTEEREKCGR